MSYYQGDYYQGDYYQGDPFLGALIGMGATWLGKKLLGRGAARAGTTAIARVGAAAGTGLVTGAATGMMVRPALGAIGRVARLVAPTVFGPPGQFFRPGLPTTAAPAMGEGGCCPSGYHLNKGVTRSGSPPGSVCVRNRAMNVANPRALRRSLRRVAGFGKLASRARKSMKAAARSV